MPAGTVVGHLHLHVASTVAAAAAFYADAVGFDRTVWRYPGTLFLGAGGYHHHLGTNTWAGPAARPAGEGDPRLLAWTLELPAADDVGELARSLAAGHAATVVGDELVTKDPWGTRLRVRVAAR